MSQYFSQRAVQFCSYLTLGNSTSREHNTDEKRSLNEREIYGPWVREYILPLGHIT